MDGFAKAKPGLVSHKPSKFGDVTHVWAKQARCQNEGRVNIALSSAAEHPRIVYPLHWFDDLMGDSKMICKVHTGHGCERMSKQPFCVRSIFNQLCSKRDILVRKRVVRWASTVWRGRDSSRHTQCENLFRGLDSGPGGRVRYGVRWFDDVWWSYGIWYPGKHQIDLSPLKGAKSSPLAEQVMTWIPPHHIPVSEKKPCSDWEIMRITAGLEQVLFFHNSIWNHRIPTDELHHFSEGSVTNQII